MQMGVQVRASVGDERNLWHKNGLFCWGGDHGAAKSGAFDLKATEDRIHLPSHDGFRLNRLAAFWVYEAMFCI